MNIEILTLSRYELPRAIPMDSITGDTSTMKILLNLSFVSFIAGATACGSNPPSPASESTTPAAQTHVADQDGDHHAGHGSHYGAHGDHHGAPEGSVDVASPLEARLELGLAADEVTAASGGCVFFCSLLSSTRRRNLPPRA